MGIQVININKKYKDTVILDDVSLLIETGELMALLGPSGSGKTTLLRIIAGLEYADSGKVILEGEETQFQPIQERKVGFVFQHYALFRHMTVFENAAFGLQVRPYKNRPRYSEIKKKIGKLLELMHLEGYEKYYPSQLSGGQQQRVALVRALAVDPKVLLLDEPFGALDAKVRKELCRWIRTLHDEIKISSMFVTHDQEEAFEVADRVCIMNRGQVQQVDSPGKIWRKPQNLFVFNFLGEHNVFDGWLDDQGNKYLSIPDSQNLQKIKLYARPYEMQLTRTPDEQPYVLVKVRHINSTGSLVKIEMLDEGQQLLVAEITHLEYDALRLKKDDWIYARPKNTFYFK